MAFNFTSVGGVSQRTLSVTFALALAMAATLLIGSSAIGATTRVFYVDAETGSDLRSAEAAKSPETPWRSLERAVKDLEAGDRVLASPGSYQLVARNLSFDSPVTIEGPRDATLALDLNDVTGMEIVGFTLNEAAFITDSSEIVVRDGTSSGGFEVVGADHLTLERMEIHNVDDPDRPPFEKAVRLRESVIVVIRESWFHNNPEDAIQASGVDGLEVVNNLFEDNGPWNGTVERDDRHSDVLQVMAGSQIVFATNRVLLNSHVLMIKSDFGDITDVTIENNLFESNGGYAIQLHGVSDITVRGNQYVCNGTYFADGCDSEDQFDINQTETENLARESDPFDGEIQFPSSTTTSGTTAVPVTGSSGTTAPDSETVTTPTSLPLAAESPPQSEVNPTAIVALVLAGIALVIGLTYAYRRSRRT